MNILVIGSKGFIGKHTTHYFKKQNCVVFGCDVVVDYEASNYFIIDSTNANFQTIFASQKFDVCINCSGAASVPDSLTNPHRDFELNVTNVFKILEAIRIHQPKCKFINLSSAAVYGNPQVLPIDENQLLKPISPYGIHKKIAEKIVTEFHTFWNIPTLSLRIFSVYGPYLKKQLFWDLSKKIINENKEIEFFGTGNESRDFIYIADLMQAFQCVISNAHFDGSSINIANGKEVFIKEAISTFIQEYMWEGKVRFSQSNRQGDPLNWKADISKLNQLGYVQQYNFKTGVQEYIQWLKEKT